jgi:hypothetical protein
VYVYSSQDDERTAWNTLPIERTIDMRTGGTHTIVIYNALSHERHDVVRRAV